MRRPRSRAQIKKAQRALAEGRQIPRSRLVVQWKPITYLTRAFYRMQGGGCRRLDVDETRRICEWPYEEDTDALCRRKGPHPHRMGVRHR